MIINNAVIDGKIQNIAIENGVITEVTEEKLQKGIDANGKYVVPGFIDIHTHGCVGLDTMDADFAPMCKFYASAGTTSFLPTTTTETYDDLLKVTKAETNFKGANILGFHFEGPYINEKYKGAQNPENIKPLSLSEFRQFENVKMITIAPELEGSDEFIKWVSESGCVVVMGHTDCDYDTALKAIENGANCLTHTFNAMPPMLHRAPGPIGAAVYKHIYAQVICDGFHVAPAVIYAAYKMFGADRMVIISDSVRCAGLPDGEYTSGGLPVIKKNNQVRLYDGTIAGGVSTMLGCVKKCVEIGIPFEDAVKMASQTPAELLGVKKGKIQKGFDADLLILNKNLDIDTVIIGGEIFKD